MMHVTNASMHSQQVPTALYSIEHGYFSAFSHQLLLDIRTQYHTDATGTIALNCSGLESITSHGINLLIMLLIFAQRLQKRLQVFGLSKSMINTSLRSPPYAILLT